MMNLTALNAQWINRKLSHVLAGSMTMPKSESDSAVEESQADAEARRARGEFVRNVSAFRHAIDDPDFPAEPGRYHLFVPLNCP